MREVASLLIVRGLLFPKISKLKVNFVFRHDKRTMPIILPDMSENSEKLSPCVCLISHGLVNISLMRVESFLINQQQQRCCGELAESL